MIFKYTTNLIANLDEAKNLMVKLVNKGVRELPMEFNGGVEHGYMIEYWKLTNSAIISTYAPQPVSYMKEITSQQLSDMFN